MLYATNNWKSSLNLTLLSLLRERDMGPSPSSKNRLGLSAPEPPSSSALGHM